MRKTLAMLLTLALMASIAAVALADQASSSGMPDPAAAPDAAKTTDTPPVATSSVNVSRYIDAATGFSIGYPSNWKLLTKDTLDTLNADKSIKNISKVALMKLGPMVKESNLVGFLGPSGVYYTVSSISAGMEVTAEYVKTSVTPSAQAKLMKQYTDVKVLVSDQLSQSGDMQFDNSAYSVTEDTDQMVIAQSIPLGGDTLYVLSFAIPSISMKDVDTYNDIFLRAVESFAKK